MELQGGILSAIFGVFLQQALDVEPGVDTKELLLCIYFIKFSIIVLATHTNLVVHSHLVLIIHTHLILFLLLVILTKDSTSVLIILLTKASTEATCGVSAEAGSLVVTEWNCTGVLVLVLSEAALVLVLVAK